MPSRLTFEKTWIFREMGKPCVWVSYSCCNKYTDKVAWTTDVHLFCPGGWDLRWWCQQGWLFLRPLSLVCRLPCVLMWASLCVYLCPHLLVLWGHQSYGNRTHPNDSILASLHPWRPYLLQIQSHSEVLGVRTSTCEWGRWRHILVCNTRWMPPKKTIL